MRIHQLPPEIANQIAAGEVIERPASVVKELLENSFDAGADTITIEIGYGGLNQIKISDNGTGIVEDDLPLAVAAHATSKINTLNDLYAIDSMGFRGEALASIASIAKVSISSRPAHQQHAMILKTHGTRMELFPCARAIGTTIDVVDLFFNAPVRKRFLKSEKIEFQAIETVIKRFALSAPHIAIILKHNGKLILSLPAALGEQAKLTRLIKIFGSAFVKDAIYLDVERSGMHLYGWISGPAFQRSQNDRQWVYINQRMVKDKLINHALKQAYDGLLHPGRYPACLLYLGISAGEVDVNVHPTKHEVRFQQPRLVHDFFTSQLNEALMSLEQTDEARPYEFAHHAPLECAVDVCEPQFSGLNQATPLNLEGLDKGLLSSRRHQPASDQPQCFALKTIPSFAKTTNLPASEALGVMAGGQLELSKVKAQNAYSTASESAWIVLNNQYILIFMHHIPHLVDAAALQQYWMYQQLAEHDLPFNNRPLLVPISYQLPKKLQKAELKENLEQIGVQIEFSADEQLLIRSIPMQVPHLDFRLFFDSIAELEDVRIDQLLELMSKSQILAPQFLSLEERMELNQLLFTEQHTFVKALTMDNCRMFLHV